MAGYKQAVKWKLEGKDVFHQGYNMSLNDDCLSMSDIDGHMGKSLEVEEFYYDYWEIYEPKVNDTPIAREHYNYVFPEKLVDDCCDKLTPEAIENARKKLDPILRCCGACMELKAVNNIGEVSPKGNLFIYHFQCVHCSKTEISQVIDSK